MTPDILIETRNLSIAIHNTCDDAVTARDLFSNVTTLPCSPTRKESIAQDIDVISGHTSIEEGKALMDSGEWEKALDCFKTADGLLREHEDIKFLYDWMRICRSAQDFTRQRLNARVSESLWDGFIGKQVQRCQNNSFWTNLVLAVVSGGSSVWALIQWMNASPWNNSEDVLLFEAIAKLQI